MRSTRSALFNLAAGLLATAMTDQARANIVLSQVILDFKPGNPPTQDIEVWNDGPDRNYVVAEPAEILSAGTPDEHRVESPDPSVLGLLVTPQRMILEPGQRRLLRIAAVLPRGKQDHIYRIAVKPVAGDVKADVTALKLLVGYDVLVMYRPGNMVGKVTSRRTAATITFTNSGNTNVEMYEGQQCDASAHCKKLPATRLYPGASFEVPIEGSAPVRYRVDTSGKSETLTF